MKTILYAQFTAKAGYEDAVAKMVRQLTDDVRKEPGNLVFDPHTEAQNPRAYFVYEVYQDEPAFQAHITAEHSKRFNGDLLNLIEEEGSIITWLNKVV